MTRPRGRALKWERLLYDVPYGHWKTTTFLAALRTSGLTAPLVIDGAIESVGASVLYLPPYRPDLNPVETVFSKFKWLIRSLGCRKVEGLWKACGEVSQVFTEPECRNHFQQPLQLEEISSNTVPDEVLLLKVSLPERK